MHHLTVILICLIVGVRCRSLTPTNLEGANDTQNLVRVHRIATEDRPTASMEITNKQLNLLDPDLTTDSTAKSHDSRNAENSVDFEREQLKNLLPNFMNWIGQSTEHEQKVTRNSQAQWLKQLTFIAKELSVKVNEVTNPTDYSKPVEKTLDSALKDLLAFADTLDIQKQLRTAEKSENDVSPTIVTHQKSTTDDSSFTTTQNGAEDFNEMLAEAQNQMGQIRRFFDRLCRKHHATKLQDEQKTKQTPIADANEPRKVSFL